MCVHVHLLLIQHIDGITVTVTSLSYPMPGPSILWLWMKYKACNYNRYVLLFMYNNFCRHWQYQCAPHYILHLFAYIIITMSETVCTRSSAIRTLRPYVGGSGLTLIIYNYMYVYSMAGKMAFIRPENACIITVY